MLRSVVTAAHQNEGIFPTFPQGTKVIIKESCPEVPDWYLCQILEYTTYIYKYLLENDRLVIDYNPTELDVEVDDELEVISIHGPWLYAKALKNDKYGWIPAEKVRSLY